MPSSVLLSNSLFYANPLHTFAEKNTVRVATAAALAAYTATATTLTANVVGALGAVDGVTLSAGDELLVTAYGATSRVHTGLYYVSSAGAVGSVWVLTRRADANTSQKLVPGMRVFVSEGTLYGNTVWRCITNATITMGTTALDWVFESTVRGVQGPANQYHRHVSWQKDIGASTAYASLGATSTPTNEGAVSRNQTSYGDYIRFTSAGALNDDAGFHAGFGIWRPDKNPRLRISWATGADITVSRFWIGLTNGILDAATDPNTNHVAAFRYDTGNGDAAFMIYTANGAGGGGSTAASSGVVPAANTRYEMEIECFNGGAGYHFWINGAYVGTATATLPGTTTNLGCIMKQRALEAVAKVIDFEIINVDEQ